MMKTAAGKGIRPLIANELIKITKQISVRIFLIIFAALLIIVPLATRGLDLIEWKQTFGADFIEPRRRKLDRLIAGGLIEINEGFLRLTLRGMEVQDAVVLELLNE